MALPRSFKTDESFLEKIAIGATGTKRAFEDLTRQGHEPIELERSSMSFKIWKSIKIKRIRVPDILCLRCGRRVESRGKTKMEISMSHSLSDPERGWDAGLNDNDAVALTHCERTDSGPLDWTASPVVQYANVESLRRARQQGQAKVSTPKGAQEGFETRITWPAALASGAGLVETVDATKIRYRKKVSNQAVTVQLVRPGATLAALVEPGDLVFPNQIIASVVPVRSEWPCGGGAGLETYLQQATSSSQSERYTAVKALGHFEDLTATEVLRERVHDTVEHIYVRVDAAAGLVRRDDTLGLQFFSTTLHDEYLANRLEAAIVLGEVATPEAVQLLITTVRDPNQNPEIRAGAAWSLGEIGTAAALSTLVESFDSLETIIKIEAARALARLARIHLSEVLQAFPRSTPAQRPGIAWALGKVGHFTVEQILPILVDEDARIWVSYILGNQDRNALLPGIERLADQDPEVYFAVTVLWKILDSWIYGLEEY